jgi:hypothetical protein
VQFLGNVLVDGFVHWAFPINFWKQMDEMNAQGGGDEQQVVFCDAERAAFDLGNGAAGGVVPAGELQLDGKVFLRPAVTLAQFSDLPSNQIQLLHGYRISISCNSICFVHPMNSRNGRRSVTTDRRFKVKLSIFVSLFLAQTRH